ncbi:MAG: hypothetical protein K2X27_17465 [Candidatus Obscuribacterales bacterium]|nr:hypothetical protein [Candidatus Obscuribacterales bacterium]
MSLKQKILTSALLGTEQQTIPELSAEGKLDSVLQAILAQAGRLGKERTLLQASAVLATYEKAGARFSKFQGEEIEKAPAEFQERIPEKSLLHLKVMLDILQDLLPEWLELISKRELRLPHDCLVAILELGVKAESIRGLIADCVGRRGLWLAALNPSWSYLLPDFEAGLELEQYKRDFELAEKDERVAALKRLREFNPGLARDLLRSSWKTESADERIRFLSSFSQGLSLEDEAFLEEEALDDKRKEVRRLAQDLLLRLPESRLANRARERLLASLKIEKGPDNSGRISHLLSQQKMICKIELTVPEQCDKSMLRDGIVAKSPDIRLGDRAWCLRQIVSLVDPQFLLDYFEITCVELLQASSGNEWQMALRRGLEDAAIRFKHSEMAKQLLLDDDSDNGEMLFACLDKKTQESILSQIIEGQGFLLVKPVQNYYNSNALNLLLRMDYRWSPEFSKVVLRTVRTHLTQKNRFVFMDHIMRHIGGRLDLDVWSLVQDSWASSAQQDAALEKMYNRLVFRREMIDALKN